LDCLRADIDTLLKAAIPAVSGAPGRLNEAMRYAVVGGGKRFRPMLTVAVAELVGAPYAQALRVGAAVECVHAQSLIHDDLPCMDDDDVRRGLPTLHRRYDEATAVLAGDALLALAFDILADEATHEDGGVRAALVVKLARAVGQDGLAGGQMMDLYPPAVATPAHVLECETRKTGSLIRFAVEAGAMLGQCSVEDRASLLRFADSLGLAFQIRDDLLDCTGDAQSVGKKLRKDERMGRKSSVAMFGLDRAKAHASRLAGHCRDELSRFGHTGRTLHDIADFAILRAC
jgi:geranylgeranyl pyrophosphate synthase